MIAGDDDGKKMAQAAQAGFATADLRQIDWSGLAALVLTPGVPLTHPAPHWSVALARAAAVEVIGDIELFCRERRRHAPNAPFVAITGTNGKSTTTALIAHIFRKAGRDVQLGGNIGTAILSLEPPIDGRNYIIEVSSYQIDLAPSLDPTVGVLLNITPDHLDRHGTMENYAAVKKRLVVGSLLAAVGIDDELSAAIAKELRERDHRYEFFSSRTPVAPGVYAQGSKLHGGGSMRGFFAELSGIGSLRGVHNAQNAAAAATVALALGIPHDDIRQALRSFPGLPHRLEEVGRKGNVLFVNDSKATNADSAAQALACFNDIFWIAGGQPKTGGIAALAEFFPRIRKAYLIGEAAAGFASELDGKVPYIIAGTLDRALALAARDAEATDVKEPVVLLSPACASFDQFRNFEVRGDAFRDLVRALPGITGSVR